MGFIGTALAVAAGKIIGDVIVVKIITSEPVVKEVKEKSKEFIHDVVTSSVRDSVKGIFKF